MKEDLFEELDSCKGLALGGAELEDGVRVGYRDGSGRVLVVVGVGHGVNVHVCVFGGRSGLGSIVAGG